MLDLVLAIGHHLAVFSVAGLLAMQLALLRPGVAGQRLKDLGSVDGAYGAAAGLVVVVGILRVIFGANGWEIYAMNWVFWLKMVLFIIVGLLSIRPTIQIFRWRKSLRTDASFTPPDGEVRSMRQILYAEAALFLLIPAVAAAMARGFGL